MDAVKEKLIAELQNPSLCEYCNTDLDEAENQTRFCSPSCGACIFLELSYGQLSKKFSDRTDVSIDESLDGYGFIRNPITTEVLWYSSDGSFTKFDIKQSEVVEKLEEASNGFFDFIGQTRENALQEAAMNPEHLAHFIQSINMYDGSIHTRS